MAPYAEVIGDPVAHSLSPLIHKYWLDALKIDGHYCAARVGREEIGDYLAARRLDPDWRGCSVTAPLKEAILPFLDRLSPEACRIGAVNCLYKDGRGLAGINSDIDGAAEALSPACLEDRAVAIIGGGGASRAAIVQAARQGADEIRILARDPSRAAGLLDLAARPTSIVILPFDQSHWAFDGAGAVINASPLGAAHAGPVPGRLLTALGAADPGAVVFDMVYDPIETDLLKAARSLGLRSADGLVMLVGQARAAFSLFFGAPPPQKYSKLREMLVKSSLRL